MHSPITRRLLIVCDPFHKPSFSPRLRYFCGYLQQRGWELDVYTEKADEIPFAHVYPIHEIPLYSGSRGDWAVKSVGNLILDWKDHAFLKAVRQMTAGKTYDAVFCTTFSTFPLPAAAALAQERHLPLILDIRDLDEQVPGAQYQHHRAWWARPFRSLYRSVNIQRRNRALRQADAISTISPWHQDFLKAFCKKVELIYNGFDPEVFYPEDVPTDRFRIGYIGKIYEFQDITPIEKAVKDIDNPEIELCLHTPDCNPIPITAVADEIRRCSIMTVLTSKEAKGMMTTKFFEALGCEKPVLCIPSDNGALAQAMRKTHAGIATDSQEDIQRFIRVNYLEWKDKGFTHQAVNPEEKDLFSRKRQAEQMEALLTEYCKQD